MPKKILPAFYFIGNHPVLDFINTRIAVDKKPFDLLASFADVLDWLHRAGYMSKEEVEDYERLWGSGEEAAKLVETAKTLRSSLLAIIEASKNGDPVADGHLEPINELLRERIVTTRLVKKDGGFVREQHVKIQAAADLLIPVAEAAISFFHDYDLALVKKCENPDCVLRFYDNSKNSTRRWCSPKTCGNRMKVAAFLERKQRKSE